MNKTGRALMVVNTFRSPNPQHGRLTSMPEADQSLQRDRHRVSVVNAVLSTLAPVGNKCGPPNVSGEGATFRKP
jgi:hypothetical protein